MGIDVNANSLPVYNVTNPPLKHQDTPSFPYDTPSIIQEEHPPEDGRNLATDLDEMRPEESIFRLIHRVNLDIEPFSKLLTLTPSQKRAPTRWEDSVSRVDAKDFKGTDEEFLGLLARFPTILVLNLPWEFKASLKKLPNWHFSYLQEVTMGDNYNQALPKDLVNLEKLTMGCWYNQTLPATLVNLQQLTMGFKYNQPLPATLVNLQQLQMGFKYDHPLPATLVNLQQLVMGCYYNYRLPKALRDYLVRKDGSNHIWVRDPAPVSWLERSIGPWARYNPTQAIRTLAQAILES